MSERDWKILFEEILECIQKIESDRHLFQKNFSPRRFL